MWVKNHLERNSWRVNRLKQTLISFMQSLPWQGKVTQLVKKFPALKQTHVRERLVCHLVAVYCEVLEVPIFVVTVGPSYKRRGRGEEHKAVSRLVRTWKTTVKKVVFVILTCWQQWWQFETVNAVCKILWFTFMCGQVSEILILHLKMLIGNLRMWYGQKESEDGCLCCGLCRFTYLAPLMGSDEICFFSQVTIN